MTRRATAADYGWWQSWRPDWADAHCVTLVGDASVDGVLQSVGAGPVTRVQGFDAFYDRVTEAEYDPDRALVGVSAHQGWAVVVEVNGFLGVTERVMGPLSPGRTIVSHFRNINSVSRFHWWHDGRLLVDADLMFPDERFGAQPQVLDEHLDGLDDIDCAVAGFVLADRITGIASTPQWLGNAEFQVAEVDLPGGEEQQRYGEALRTTWRAPASW